MRFIVLILAMYFRKDFSFAVAFDWREDTVPVLVSKDQSETSEILLPVLGASIFLILQVQP